MAGMGERTSNVKPTEDATIGEKRRRDSEQVQAADSETNRWRRAMTRRDRPDDAGEVTVSPDAPYLPSGWCRRRDDTDEVAFVREGGEMRLSATRENGAWRLTGTQRSGEAEHDCRIGGAPTRAEALRCLFDAMERINDRLSDADWGARICLDSAVQDTCKYDAEATDHLVR